MQIVYRRAFFTSSWNDGTHPAVREEITRGRYPPQRLFDSGAKRLILTTSRPTPRVVD